MNILSTSTVLWCIGQSVCTPENARYSLRTLENPGMPAMFTYPPPERNQGQTTNLSAVRRFTYTVSQLSELRYKGRSKLDFETVRVLKSNGIFKNRGRRGGRKTRRKISTRITKRNEKSQQPVRSRVLTPVKYEQNKIDATLPVLLLTNPQSLTNVYEEFYARVFSLQADIVSVSETWFSTNKPACLHELPGYRLLHKDRETRGGGVAQFIKASLTSFHVNINVPTNLECVWGGLQGNFTREIKKLVVCSLYYPPGADTHDDLVEHLITSVDTIRSTYSDVRVVIMGDCNDLDKNYLINHLNLRCIVNEPTHMGSVLDLILTDAECYTTSEIHAPIGLSRHKCVVSRPSTTNTPRVYALRTYRPRLDSAVRQFGLWITHEEWMNISGTADVSEEAAVLERMLMNKYTECFPLRQQRIREENKPWITAKILKMMEDRRRAWDRGRMDQWRHLHNRVKIEIKKAKKSVAQKIEEHDVNSTNFAKDLKSVLDCEKKKLNIHCLNNLGEYQICQEMKNHFTNICTFFPHINVSQLPSFLPAFPAPSIDRLDVYHALKSVKLGKASPPDSFPKYLLKEFAYEISEPLARIFNSCLIHGNFPTAWKCATITPLPKKPIITQLSDLRPLSLTPDLGKILEGFVANMILDDIKENLDPFQYGNLKGYSTSHYLICLLNNLLKGLDAPKKIASVVLIDFQKAFDRIDHTVAVTELYLLGCRPSLLPFIINFLSNRKHRVRYGDILSDWDEITSGVPQGTKLGPIIFLAVVNSICRNSPLHFKYVDDMTLAEIIDVNDRIDFNMQNTLNTLENQCITLKMSPNPLKCEVFYVCPPKRPIVFPQLTLNDVALPVVQQCKLLGVVINNGLSWNDHVSHMIKKANNCFFLLYRARQFNFSTKTLFQVYVWYIRTSLEYAVPVWHPGLTQAQHNSLERLQKRAFRIILGNQYNSYNNALSVLNTKSLFERRNDLTVKFGNNLMSSPKHRSLLPPLLHEVHGRDTRHGGRLLQAVRCRTSRYKNSTIPFIVNKLNQCLM